jgi:hypothetical protein
MLTRYISESSGDAVVLVVDDQWTTTLDAAAIPHFTFTCTESLGVVHLKQKNLELVRFDHKDQFRIPNINASKAKISFSILPAKS